MSHRSFQMTDDDPHLARIAHRIDMGVDEEGGDLLFRYNYLTYEFDHPLGVVDCKAHIDDIRVVSVFGLAADVDVEIEDAVILRWLRARFARVERLGEEGYVEI